MGVSYGAPWYTGIGAPESCISLRRASLSRSVMASDKAGTCETGAAPGTSGRCFGIPQTPPLPEVFRRPSSRIFRGITSCLMDDILDSSSRRAMPSADRPWGFSAVLRMPYALMLSFPIWPGGICPLSRLDGPVELHSSGLFPASGSRTRVAHDVPASWGPDCVPR